MWYKLSQNINSNIYIRFGDLPENFSWNHLLQKKEKGVSVYETHKDPITNKYVIHTGSEQMILTLDEISSEDRPIYLVTGEDTGHTGDDGEPLLKLNTINIIKSITKNDVVTDNEPWLTLDGYEIDDEQENKEEDKLNVV